MSYNKSALLSHVIQVSTDPKHLQNKGLSVLPSVLFLLESGRVREWMPIEKSRERLFPLGRTENSESETNVNNYPQSPSK